MAVDAMITLIVGYWAPLKEKCVSEVTNAVVRTGKIPIVSVYHSS
jgi:hypothetical protein